MRRRDEDSGWRAFAIALILMLAVTAVVVAALILAARPWAG